MSGAVHTPGPWRWRDDQVLPMGQWTLSPGILIADGNDGTPGGDEHDRANASLIAAAPDMLALLTELIDIEGPCPGTATWANKVDAVIAKATGAK